MKGLRVTSSGMPYSHIQISTGKPFTATYFKCTSDRYSQWFQTRLIHRILPTNSLLFQMNLTENKLYSFWNTCEEILQHLFFECPKIKP